jgi:hypothetical protein
MKRLLLILQLGLIAITCNVNASIINYDTAAYGAYKDTETGLVWLDFGQNNNQSYNDVVSQLGAGNTWEGWRLPTLSEVYTMWANVADLENVVADYENPNEYGPDQLSAIATNGLFIIGDTDESVWEEVFDVIGFDEFGDGDYENGFYTTQTGQGYFMGTDGLSYVQFFDFEVFGDLSLLDRLALRDDANRDLFKDSIGSTTLLIKQADSPPTDLPAPSTIAILGLGLLGLVTRRKLF